MAAAVFIYFVAGFFEVEIWGMGPLITVSSQKEKSPVLEGSLYNFAEISHHAFGFSGAPADSSLGRVFFFPPRMSTVSAVFNQLSVNWFCFADF